MKNIYLFALIFCYAFISKSQTTSADYAVMVQATIGTTPPSITLHWKNISKTKWIRVYRKKKNDVNWGSPLAILNSSVTQFTDNNVNVGYSYEYSIQRRDSLSVAYGYIYSGINIPEVAYRGKMLLLVDANYSIPLTNELSQLQMDLVGDGWAVKRIDIQRASSVKSVKTTILNEVKADAETKALYLLGRIPVPYSGDFDTSGIPYHSYPPDGHYQHSGAWPADLYYGTLNESIWTDVTANDTVGTRTNNHNVPGDGKFDIDYIYNDTVALQIGRVDLTNMPSFGLSDTLLTKQYLIKAHVFKTGMLNVSRKGLVYDNFGTMGGEAFASSGWRDFAPMFGDSVFNKSYLTGVKQGSYLFSYGCGAGNYNSCQGIGFSNVFNNDSINTVFTSLFGSFFGDWDSPDNFLRAPLCSRPSALASTWSGRPYWHFHHMALGENIGYSTRLTQNNYSDTVPNVFGYTYNNYPTYIHIALMGDPSLRLHPMKPCVSLNATTSTDSSTVTLSWKASVDATSGYVILGSTQLQGKYLVLSKVTASDTSYTATVPANGMFYYMIRPLKLETTPSGNYYNLAPGIIDSAYGKFKLGVEGLFKQINRVTIFPNPTNGKFTIKSDELEGNPLAICYDIFGRVLLTAPLTTSQQEIDLTSAGKGIYLVQIVSSESNIVKKIIIE